MHTIKDDPLIFSIKVTTNLITQLVIIKSHTSGPIIKQPIKK